MDTPKPCPDCGSEIPPDAPGGWCPRCTFQQLAQEEADEHQGALSLHDIPPPGANVSYIGDYELIEVIAHGGMGVVYKARQKSLNRIVALKLLLGGAHASEDFKRRFRQEAELAAKLQHPNIVPIYEVGEHGGQPYFSMEYVAGSNLADLTRDTPLPPRMAAQSVRVVAEAIAFAHEQGVVHRDLKPSNILVGMDDRIRVTDFGLARQLSDESSLTLSGDLLGTPGYLPPEQISAKKGAVGPQSDVYALGAILYHLLTGRPPFMAGTLADVLQLVLHKEPVSMRRLNSAIPEDLDTITRKCMEKIPARRYATAGELASDLERFLSNQPILARAPSRMYRFRKLVRRNKLAFAGGSVVSASLVIGTLVSTWLYYQEKDAGRKASQAQAKAVMEAAKSREVAEFLKSLFEGVQAEVAMGRDTTLIRDILDKGAQRIDRELKHESEVRLELLALLADSYRSLNLAGRQEAMALQGLPVAESLHGVDSLPAAVFLSHLAAAKLKLGQATEAESLARKVLTIRQRELGSVHADVADALQTLALVLAETHAFEEAEKHQRECVRQRRLQENAFSYKLIDSTAALGNVLANAGKLEDAVKIFEEALRLSREGLGENHPLVVSILNDLAACLGRQSEFQAAEAIAREALPLAQTIHGRESVLTAILLGNLGTYLEGQRRFADAEPVYREAIAMHQKLNGETDPGVHLCMRNLANCLLRTGKFNEASEWYQRLIALTPATDTEESQLRESKRSLAWSLAAADRWDEALPLFRSSLTDTNELNLLGFGVPFNRAIVDTILSDWKRASVDLGEAIKRQPDAALIWYLDAAVLLHNADRATYEARCHAMLERFADSRDPVTARLVAKASNLSQLTKPDRAISRELAVRAIAINSGQVVDAPSLLTLGLAEFRGDQYSIAADLMRQFLERTNTGSSLRAQAGAVLAMASHKLGQSQEAQSALAFGLASVPGELPKSRPFLFTTDWVEHMVALSLLAEARVLVSQPQATQNPSASSMPPQPQGNGDPKSRLIKGFLAQEFYAGIPGWRIRDLTNHPSFNATPTRLQRISTFEAQGDIGTDSGVRIYGFLTTPLTGNHVFYLCADDQAEVYLSIDDSAKNKRLVAYTTNHARAKRSWNSAQSTTIRPPETSADIYLEAGKQYYVEALLKQAGGPGFLGLAWRLPGEPPPKLGSPPIQSNSLSYAEPNSPFKSQPQSITVTEGQTVHFQVGLVSPSFSNVTWTRDGETVATNGSCIYATPRLRRSDTGAKYRCLLRSSYEPGIIASEEAVVTVIPDTQPPELISAVNFPGSNVIYVAFSEPLDPDTALGGIHVSTSAGQVTNISMGPEDRFVLLTLATVTNSDYEVATTGIRDWAGNEIKGRTIVAGRQETFVPQFICPPSVISSRNRQCIPYDSDGFDLITDGGNTHPTKRQQDFQFACRPVTGDFDAKVLLARHESSKRYAGAALMARESLSHDASYVDLNAEPADGNRWSSVHVVTVRNGNHTNYNLPVISKGKVYPVKVPKEWMRIRRSGNTFVTFRSTNGRNWSTLWSVEVDMPDTLYLGVGAHADGDGQGYVSFRHLTVTQPKHGQRWSPEEVPVVRMPSVDRFTNSLGMIFTRVAGTEVLFSIWDARVQDFELFVKDANYVVAAGMESLGTDGWKVRGHTWQNPGFDQSPTHPVVGVNKEDAGAFCRWLTEKERRAGNIPTNSAYRLPFVEEWQVARAATRYPWGDAWPPPSPSTNLGGEEAKDGTWPPKRGIIKGFRDGFARTSPVDAFPANKFGLHDMAGNIWQWDEDGENANGGSWYDIYEGNTMNWFFGSGVRISHVGFRCVLEIP